MANIYGIDLGHRTVRLTTFEGSFGRLNYVDRAEAAVAQDIQAPADLTTRLAALDSLFQGLERHASDMYIMGFPAEQASVRRIHMPFEDREKVEQALPFEVENQVPFDLDNMVLTSRMAVAESGGSNVMCGMAPRGAVAGLLSTLNERGIDPKALVIDADLLGHFASDGVQVILDLGHTRTLVTLCQGGRVVDVRAITQGGRRLTMALVEKLGLGFEAAEAQKHTYGIDPTTPSAVEAEWGDVELTEPNAELGSWDDETTMGEGIAPLPTNDGAMVAATLKEALVPLLSDLRSTLIAMEDRHGLDISEVLLTGGGARMNGLRPLLTDVLGVPTRPAHVEENGDPTFALSHAAAARVASGKGRLLDLRVGAFAFRGNLAAIGNIIRYSLLGAAALLLAGVGFYAFKTVSLNSDLAAVESEMADAVVTAFPDVNRDKVSDPVMAQAIMAERSGETASLQAALKHLIPEEPPILSLWEALANNVPSAKTTRIDVLELSISEGTIQVKAETDGFEDASKIESSLQKYPKFKEARKSDEKKVKESVRFTVTIPLGAEETEEG